jgi:hypothetical protein
METHPDDQISNEELARKAEEAADRLALAWQEVARTPAGKFVLKDLKSRCNVENSCIAGDAKHPDPYAVMFQEGKRAVMNHIYLYLRHEIK